MKHNKSIIALVSLVFCLTQPSFAIDRLSQDPDVSEFIDHMVQTHQMEREELTTIFDNVVIQDDVLEAIARPAEYLPWYRYRPIFLTQTRVDQGLEFWQTHEATLQKAEATYGVPAEVIVAIIGVETSYGRNTGDYRVLDSLSTLAFEYPPRSAFFKQELEELFLLAEEENIDIHDLKGSYAGAMGMPQFIASSYRYYSVDFTEDGQRDLLGNVDDAIGSVGNYLSEHGWRNGEVIAIPAVIENDEYQAIQSNDLRPAHSIADWEAHGVMPVTDDQTDTINEQELATLVELEITDDVDEPWLGLNNFYMITRYNRSNLYAMAVYQLSEDIRAARGQS